MSHSTDVSDFQPTSLSHLIGQRNVIRQVEVALDACQQDCKRFDHAMLVGPPGLGKSVLAGVIAQEMAADFHEVLGQSLNNVADLNGLLLAARDKDIVFVDEAHEMKRMFQTALYLALDKQCVFIKGANSSPQGIPIGKFSLLLATTDEFCLLQPLRDRMKLLLRYEFYSEEELGQIIRHRGRALGWDIEETLIPQIAQRSKGTPRLDCASCNRATGSAGRSARPRSQPTTCRRHADWNKSTIWAWVRTNSSISASWPRVRTG